MRSVGVRELKERTSKWSTLDQVAREIGARWPRRRSAAAAVREGRRDL